MQEQLACSSHARPAEGALTRRPQEQLACSAHARPAEGALTRPTVQRPGRCLRLLSGCSVTLKEARGAGWSLAPVGGLWTKNLCMELTGKLGATGGPGG